MKPVETVLQRLHERGERVTIQRRLVVEALSVAENHISIPDIQRYTESKGATLDVSTVYRILERLIDLEMVCRTDVGTSGVVYELMNEPHHHLICLACGDISVIPDTLFQNVRTQLKEQYNFQPRLDHMAIFGYCQGCRNADQPESHSAHP